MARDRRVAIILMHLANSERGESGAFFAPESPFRTAAPESLLNSETGPLGRFLFSEDLQALAGENPIGGGVLLTRYRACVAAIDGLHRSN